MGKGNGWAWNKDISTDCFQYDTIQRGASDTIKMMSAGDYSDYFIAPFQLMTVLDLHKWI
jgi:hypothetical protein